jgi:ABC-type branched-subunit amino acid transport system substrate-binding protein
LGGSIDVTQWYYSGATNYKRQLENLIKIGADSLGIRFELSEEEIEQLIVWDEEDDEEELDPFGIEMADTTIVDSLLDIYTSPVNFFEALYVPFKGEEILSLAPQIAASGFDGYLIGSSNCLEFVNRESNMRYVNGIIFPAHFQSYPEPSAASNFIKKYRSLSGEVPDVWNLLGWDAFRFLAAALQEEDRISSYQITRTLQQVTEFEGDRISYKFPDGSRLNHSIYILGFENGNYHLLEKASAPVYNPGE